ncbi:MAG: peptidyl-prolyl cis-trans isomerase [Flavobacteriaceae bacterium]|nr:peptidyl-prolyl cis-trans isomerase [Flavobacteriaceae bacterium]|tara:strand:- start:53320 stop:54174 length:855 start_codon:yes stop_codon:yes gene_type:complete
MNKIFLTINSLIVLYSCDYINQDNLDKPIARVNDSYLYQKDIKNLIFENTSKNDSTLIVTNFINRWATKQLLIDQSIINLTQEKQDAYNNLVNQYKTDLYIEAYKGSIVAKRLDSIITIEELEKFYNQNKENFKLNDDLLKIRYIHIDENFSNTKELVEKFKRFDSTDKNELTNLSIKFKAFNLNDSIWIKNDLLIGVLPVLKQNNNQLLKKTNFTQLQDSLGVYLVQIEAVLKTNDIAPLSYVKPTIEQIVINKRKQEILKKIEKEITIDAIKNKNFELFTEN